MYINTFRLLAFIILFAIIIIVEITFKKLSILNFKTKFDV